jgi:selenocysteine-specific elongation factor
LSAAGREPPSVRELSEVHGVETEGLLRLLERDGAVVQIEPTRYYAAAAVKELLAVLRQGMADGRPYGPAELREMLGFSRKYLIPFLEYCDRSEITVREADGRVLNGT